MNLGTNLDKSKLTVFSIIFSLFLIFPIFGLSANSQFLTIKTSPTNPAPNQEIVVILEYYLSDLQRSEISWFINGQLAIREIGKTRFEFKAPELGNADKISVLIITPTGQEIRGEIMVQPAEVDLVWNADTYTPPFYQGRAIYTAGSSLSVSAISNFINASGEQLDPKTLFYRWYQDGQLLSSRSGLGRQTLNIAGRVVTRPMRIKVEVSTANGSISASQETIIVTFQPDVFIYEKSPTLGLLLNKALSDFEIQTQEITISAIPYFFSTVLKEGRELEFFWQQDGRSISPTDGRGSLTVRKESEGVSGQTKISVGVRHSNKIMQTAGTEATIISK